MKKLLIILLSLSLTACGDEGSYDSPANDNNLPPLTYTYKFDNCPFEVRLPVQTTKLDNDPIVEQIQVILGSRTVYVDCTDTNQLELNGNTIEHFAEEHLLISLNTNIYSEPNISKEVPENIPNAHIYYNALIIDFGVNFKTHGVVIIKNEYVLRMEYSTSLDENHYENAIEFFKTAFYNDNN